MINEMLNNRLGDVVLALGYLGSPDLATRRRGRIFERRRRGEISRQEAIEQLRGV